MRGHLVAKIRMLIGKKTATLDDYKDLVTAVLSRVILFNAKRGGEAGKMLLDNYNNSQEGPQDDFGLTELEQKLTSR